MPPPNPLDSSAHAELEYPLLSQTTRSDDEFNFQNFWSSLKPTYWRSFKALVRKSVLTKVRDPFKLLEFIVACVIYLLIYLSYYFGSRTHHEHKDPPVEWEYPPGIGFLLFINMTRNATLIGMPENDRVKDLINTTFLQISQVQNFSEMLNILYTDSIDSMADLIYSQDFDGMGIYWENSEDDDYLINPKIHLYTQGINIPGITIKPPDHDALDLIRMYLSFKLGDIETPLPTYYNQEFARAAYVYHSDMRDTVAAMSIFPIVFATMPEIQSILEEKDSKVISLAVLMGCPESAYFICSFLFMFIFSIFPYLGISFMFIYWFGMVGSSFWMLTLVSFLFIIAHTFFVLFLTTLFTTASQGRILTVILLLLTIFFAELHKYYTTDPSNNDHIVGNIFSIIPLSAYELFYIAGWSDIENRMEPLTWKYFNAQDSIYPPMHAVIFLSADIVLYLLLFLLFNATCPRAFGAPPLKLSAIFQKKTWKRLMRKRNHRSPINQTFIEVNGMRKRYKHMKVDALNDVDFKIDCGEVIVVIGPNGAGKSTMMNVLTGALEPTEGQLTLLGGEPTESFQEVQDYLGVCFQDNVLISLLTVREHFEIFGVFRGMNKEDIEKSMYQYCEALQLVDMMNTRACDLSGGQKRKLCISISLLGSPPIVVMDEPTAGVDVNSRTTIWKTIAALNDVTTLVTSHALEEAEAVASRLFIMSKGKLAFQGTSTELRKVYKCGYMMRVDCDDMERVLEFVKRYVEEAEISVDRGDTINMPVVGTIAEMLREFKGVRESLGVRAFSVSVEQLEDVLIKMIQTDEAAYEGCVHHD